MALPELLRALRNQAAERRDAELARADDRANGIRIASQATLAHRRIEFLSRIRREEEEAAHRAVSRARLEAAQSVLGARGRLLGRVGRAVEERIGSAEHEPEYRASIPQALRAGLDRLPPGSVIVKASPALAALITAQAGDLERIDVEAVAEMGAGFTVHSADHGVEVDGTLATSLRYAWPLLAVAVLTEVGP